MVSTGECEGNRRHDHEMKSVVACDYAEYGSMKVEATEKHRTVSSILPECRRCEHWLGGLDVSCLKLKGRFRGVKLKLRLVFIRE